MKNKVFLTFLILISLSSCSLFWWESQEIIDAKKELLWDNYNNVSVDSNKGINSTNSGSIDNLEVENVKLIDLEYLTDEVYFSLDDINEPNSNTSKIDFNWKTDFLLDKIEVSFTNKTSSFPDDNYQLKSFNTWDKTFTYRAYKEYQVLDTGLNEYIITAFFWDKVSKLKVSIYIPEEGTYSNEKDVSLVTKTIWTENNNIFIELPESDVFWEVVMMWEDTFTYSNIENLEIKKLKKTLDINCDNLTNYLINSYWWTFWNTCRQLNWDNWYYFNVIRLEWENYFYERHYLDNKHWIYWIFILEKWTWVDKNNISLKNDDLKNKDFKELEIVNNLFNIISK